MNIAKSPSYSLIAQESLLTTHQELYSNLLALKFDSGFLPRLLRETGWTQDRCDRAIHEYKRFLFLHRTTNHTVVPSHAVDQVWHLHLLYTRSYWEELCDGILKTPLHHHPGTAAGDQRAFFWGNYEATLKSYSTIFNETPPADIWPEPALQFDRTPPKPTHWQIPKPRLPKLAMPRIPSWGYYLAIALLTITIVITQRINLFADFASTLKYGLVALSMINGVLFLITTRSNILEADRLAKLPLEVDPQRRKEVDLVKLAMERLGREDSYNSTQTTWICLAAFTAIYIQCCQATHSLFLISADYWWLLLGAGMFIIALIAVIAETLDKIITHHIFQQLKRQKKIALREPSRAHNWQKEVHQHRTRICRSCHNAMERLQIKNIEQFFTEKEKFAHNLDSINISYRHDHCTQCSPPPNRTNFNLQISPKNGYFECRHCKTIARKTTTTTLKAATTIDTGKELLVEECAYCHDRTEQTKIIPKVVEETCNDGCHGCY